MTPSARVQAAIGILDTVLQGQAAERALTAWARRSRFAGSKDRAAVRDHVFSAIRRKRSSMALGKGVDGRAIMIGLLRGQGLDLDLYFDGQGHGAASLSPAEQDPGTLTDADARDLQDWVYERLSNELGGEAEPVSQALRDRAGVFLRVNQSKCTQETAQDQLRDDGIDTALHPDVPFALRVLAGERKVAQSRAYQNGLVELQDASSQRLITSIPFDNHKKVLDYCAGGGGKALAVASVSGLAVDVHDANPQRMKDIPARATRAGAVLRPVDPKPGYDLILCDVPCSGSGAWRRSPESKWTLTSDEVAGFANLQLDILSTCATLASEQARIVYMTCSMFRAENQDVIARFCGEKSDWSVAFEQQHLPDAMGDGLYAAHLTRD